MYCRNCTLRYWNRATAENIVSSVRGDQQLYVHNISEYRHIPLVLHFKLCLDGLYSHLVCHVKWLRCRRGKLRHIQLQYAGVLIHLQKYIRCGMGRWRCQRLLRIAIGVVLV
jgi:hypothetical protein